MSEPMLRQLVLGTTSQVPIAVTRSTRRLAGRRRLARRAQKLSKDMRPVDSSSRMSSPVIKNPEMTKKTSTPTKPPVAQGTRA